MINVPDQITHMRERMARVYKYNGLAGLLLEDMLKSIKVVNTLPLEISPTESLQIFYFANYKTEALEMVRDCIVATWLDAAMESQPHNLDKSFSSRQGLLTKALFSLHEYSLGLPNQVQKDDFIRAGANVISSYERTTMAIFGETIWRYGQRMNPLQEIMLRRKAWRHCACAATFMTDIKYGEYISPNTVSSWR